MKTYNETKIYNAIELSKATKVPMLLMGNPGIGKTTTVMNYAKENGYNVVEVRAAQSSPEDILGYYVNEGGKSLVSKLPSWFTKMQEEAEKGLKHILFLDEITTANEFTQAALFKLIFDRAIEENKLPEDTIILSAGNYKGNLSDNFGMLSPTLNRFCIVNLDNGMLANDITQYVTSTLGLDYDANKKEDKFETDTFFSNDEVLEKEKIKHIVEFVNGVTREKKFFDNESVDFGWISEVKGKIYGVASPRTISYLTKVLKASLDINVFDIDIVKGLIGYGTGSEKMSDENTLNEYHEHIKEEYAKLIRFREEMYKKYSFEGIEANIDEVLGMFKDQLEYTTDDKGNVSVSESNLYNDPEVDDQGLYPAYTKVVADEETSKDDTRINITIRKIDKIISNFSSLDDKTLKAINERYEPKLNEFRQVVEAYAVYLAKFADGALVSVVEDTLNESFRVGKKAKTVPSYLIGRLEDLKDDIVKTRKMLERSSKEKLFAQVKQSYKTSVDTVKSVVSRIDALVKRIKTYEKDFDAKFQSATYMDN